jgi:hypothetical protein
MEDLMRSTSLCHTPMSPGDVTHTLSQLLQREGGEGTLAGLTQAEVRAAARSLFHCVCPKGEREEEEEEGFPAAVIVRVPSSTRVQEVSKEQVIYPPEPWRSYAWFRLHQLFGSLNLCLRLQP